MTRPRAVAQMLFAAARNFYRDNGLDLSATVAFYALLSIGPLLYLVGLTLNLALSGDRSLDEVMERIAAFVPPEVVTLLRSVVANLRHGKPVYLIAIPGLIWVATSALSALESAINVTHGTAPQRKIWHSRLKALVVLATGCAVLGLSLVSGSLMPGLERLRQQLGVPGTPLRFPALSSYPVQMIASYLVFVSFYKWLPRGRIAWRAAAGGGVLALFLWECARRLFTMILTRSPAFGLLTGTLAGVVAFLFWIYTAVAVVLLGSELAALANGSREKRVS